MRRKWRMGSALALAAVMVVNSVGVMPMSVASGKQVSSQTYAIDDMVAGQVAGITNALGDDGFMWDGSKVRSVGSNTAQAVLNGEGMQITDTEDGSVLSVSDGGYLELPSDLFADVTDGFTISYKVKPDVNCADGANVFETNISGNSTGDTFWKDAPQLALKVGGEYVSYVGARTINGTYHNNATYNNGVGADDKNYAEPNGYKSRYKADTAPLNKGEWNEVAISVSKTGVVMSVNGKLQMLKAQDTTYDLQSNLEYLFSDLNINSDKTAWIQEYVFSSIGGSVYSDEPAFEGQVDDVIVYNEAFSKEQLTALPENATYQWTFDADTIEASDVANYVSDLTKYDGEVALEKVDALTTTSPDGLSELCIWTDEDNNYYYSVTRDGKVMIESSKIGLTLEETDLSTGLTCEETSSTVNAMDETYTNISGRNAIAYDKCNERIIRFTKGTAGMDLVVRVYDDGFAYRYTNVSVEDATELTVTDEASEFILSDKASTWAFNLNGTYEGEFIKRNNKTLVETEARFSTPVLANVEDYWILFSEAMVFNNNADYCSSALETKTGNKHLTWTFGDARDPNKESVGDLDSPGHIKITQVNTRNGFATPWRAAVISNDLNGFTNSTLIANLNPKADETLFADTSWIKPGKVAWSWWSEDEAQGDYNKHVEYIDFAAKNGWEYVCLDVGWVAFEDRLAELCAYAKEKGVGIFVWINYRDMTTYEKVDEKFEAWAAAGAVGIKADYFESDEQKVLDIMEYAAKKSAEEKMMILYHGCVRPAGEYRTYPNILSTEAVQGEEWHKWFAYPTAQNCLLYPFTRNILGSMDYTPAATKIGSSNTTFGFSIAQAVVYESGLQHFANAASLYKKYNGLSLLNNIPTAWDESTMLEGYPGKYVTIVRKNKENYFVGAMTTNDRTVDIALDFLDDGEYHAYIYKDNEDGTQLVIEQKTVTKQEKIEETLLENGGVAIMLTKQAVNLDVVEEADADSPYYIYYEAESAKNVLEGTAVVSGAAFCSGAQKVGYVGLGVANKLTFKDITVEKDGWYELQLFYCTGENRKVNVMINGTDEYTYTNLNSGSFNKPAMASIKVQLKKGANSICFDNNNAYAPDIDRIAVSKATVEADGSNNNGSNHQSSNGNSTNHSNNTNDKNQNTNQQNNNQQNVQTGVGQNASQQKVTPKKVTIIKQTASNQKKVYMKKGSKVTLTVDVKPQAAKSQIVWKSTKPSVATVENGVVKAKKAGKVTSQVVSKDGKKVYAKVKVVVSKKAVKTKSIKATKKVYKVKKGKTITIKTMMKPVKSTAKVRFKVKNKKIAKVDKKTGVVTGKKKGTTKCTIKTSDGKKYVVTIKVK